MGRIQVIIKNVQENGKFIEVVSESVLWNHVSGMVKFAMTYLNEFAKKGGSYESTRFYII